MLTHLAQHLPAPCPDRGAASGAGALQEPCGSWLFSLFWCKPAEAGRTNLPLHGPRLRFVPKAYRKGRNAFRQGRLSTLSPVAASGS